MRAYRLCRRRPAFLVLATAAVFVSHFVSAEEPARQIARLGFVSPESPSSRPRGVDEFWQRLHELGWVEGRNFVVERRSAKGRIDQLPALMTEVIERKVDVLVTWGTRSVLAARNATGTIPIVAATMGDPVRSGLATSLAHPDGNVSTVAVIGDLGNPVARQMARELESTAPTLRTKALVIEVNERKSLDRAFKQARREAQAVLVLGDIFTFEPRQQITTLAARYRLPTMYPTREYVDSGGLMAYGVDGTILWRRAADYVDKILKGAKPGDLPIEQPTQYQLVVNLGTAKALGIIIPESILMRADEVVR